MKTKNNVAKKIMSLGLVVGLSVTALSNGVDSLVKADDTNKVDIKADKVNEKAVDATVVEKDGKVFVVVAAKENITDAALNVSVDKIKYEKLSLGNMAKGEVKEIELEMPVNGEAPVKRLPNTAAVSDRVDFEKEVQGHKIKGSVSYTYDNGVNVEKPEVPSTPEKPEVPSTPEKPEVPSTPEKPSVDGLKPADEDVLRALQFILDDAHKGHKIEYKNVSVDKNVDLEVEYVDDDTLEEGKIVLKRAGSPMVVRTITREIYVDGVHIPKYTMLMDRIEIKQGVAKVYARGTKKVENVKPTDPTKPEQPGTPEQPKEESIEAGMPKNVKWTRTQLQGWGFKLGKITGNYAVDGDLGVFNTEDELDNAYKAGIAKIDDMIKKHEMTIDDAEKTPHGYAWSEVNKGDGTVGYKANVYGSDGISNDGK